jgi:hypothetical protein
MSKDLSNNITACSPLMGGVGKKDRRKARQVHKPQAMEETKRNKKSKSDKSLLKGSKE